MFEASPHLKHEELASLFGTNKTTILRTLRDKEKWLNSVQPNDVKVARHRRVLMSISRCCP